MEPRGSDFGSSKSEECYWRKILLTPPVLLKKRGEPKLFFSGWKKRQDEEEKEKRGGGMRRMEGGSNSRTSLKDPIYPKRIFSSLWLAVAPPCKINDPESPHWVFLVYSSCSMHVAAGCMHVYPEKVSQIEIEEGGERPKKGWLSLACISQAPIGSKRVAT